MTAIQDYVVVHIKDKEDHNTNFPNLMDVAAKNDLVFNSLKFKIKRPSITFYSSKFSNSTIKLDLSKIQGILDVPAADDITTLQSFLGM